MPRDSLECSTAPNDSPTQSTVKYPSYTRQRHSMVINALVYVRNTASGSVQDMSYQNCAEVSAEVGPKTKSANLGESWPRRRRMLRLKGYATKIKARFTCL